MRKDNIKRMRLLIEELRKGKKIESKKEVESKEEDSIVYRLKKIVEIED
jgi:hypothetical protein